MTPNVRRNLSTAQRRKHNARLLRKRLANRIKGYFTGFVKIGLTPRQRRKKENLKAKRAKA